MGGYLTSSLIQILKRNRRHQFYASFAFASRKAEVSLQRSTGSYPRGRKRGVGGDIYTEIQHFLVYKYDKSTGCCADTVLYFKDL